MWLDDLVNVTFTNLQYEMYWCPSGFTQGNATNTVCIVTNTSVQVCIVMIQCNIDKIIKKL